MKFKKDNFEAEVVGGQLRVAFYSTDDKATVQMKVKLPEAQAGEAKVVLSKASGLLDMLKTRIDSYVSDIGKEG